jgi:hydrogenase maturation protein HypF
MEMEALAAREAESADAYDFVIDDQLVFDQTPVWVGMIADLRAGIPVATIAARFHASAARLIVRCCAVARSRTGANTVGLTGGVFQNVLLTKLARVAVEREGFEVLTHRIVPPNDGGLALGQTVAAISRIRQK